MRTDGALRRRRSRCMIPDWATEANRLASESALQHDFEVERAAGEPAFKVDLDGFEGPLDLLLELARRQKVDLARISILELANQYLAFVEAARELRLELAADYLVMAAWLAYLKSRLLLPVPPKPESEDAAGLADALAQRLRRLEQIRRAAELLINRPRIGRDVFSRGAPEAIVSATKVTYEATLYDLLSAYARQSQKRARQFVRLRKREVWSLAEAREALTRMLGQSVEWTGSRELADRLCGGSENATHRARVVIFRLARTGARGFAGAPTRTPLRAALYARRRAAGDPKRRSMSLTFGAQQDCETQQDRPWEP